MVAHRSRRAFLAGCGAAALPGLAGCADIVGGGGRGGGGGGGGGRGRDSPGSPGGEESPDAVDGRMTIFHAGSLEAPMGRAEQPFEQRYGIDVDREAKGSVGSTRKITDQGRSADVLGVSDFRLVRDLMVPEFAAWYTVFATNAMTVVYTADSKYADEFGPDTWWDVLAREDVRVAHSDPAVDPNGYRSVMAMRLGARKLGGSRLYDPATAETLQQNAEVGAGTETELIGQIQAGALDYAWEYQSAGTTHDVQTVDLQAHVDLSKVSQKYATHYGRVSVSAGGRTFTGAPIAYGMTVPAVATNPRAGAAWVEYFATAPGRTILEERGFVPIQPVVVPSATEDAVPERVLTHATAKASLGPLQLDPKRSTSTRLMLPTTDT